MESKGNFIRLTQEKWVEVDKDDLIWLTRYKWYAKKNKSKSSPEGKFYAARSYRIGGFPITVYMHREIMDCPDSKEVDHKNDNSLCNKRENLVVLTRKQHMNKMYC